MTRLRHAMLSWRLMGSLLGSILINWNLTTCRSPGEDEKKPGPQSEQPTNVELAGVDTSELTAREKRQWSAHVQELLAPCEDTPVSIAECVEKKRDCAGCVPAAQFLVQQVQRGRTKAQADAAYRTRFSPDQVQQIDLTGSPSKGPPDAPVVIVEWADFECPACRAAGPEIEEAMAKHPEKVRIVFKNFPLDIHQNAEKAARAAMAADLQGKFWPMHAALFSTAPPLSKPTIMQLAKNLELDMKKFEDDWASEKVADAVARDRKQGEAVKLRATPTIYVNGREFNYSEDLSGELDEWIRLELQLKGDQPKAPAPPEKKDDEGAEDPKAAPEKTEKTDAGETAPEKVQPGSEPTKVQPAKTEASPKAPAKADAAQPSAAKPATAKATLSAPATP